ncbi:MAG: hypothetical protein WBA45_00640 [Microthrixaceae bacterium]
MSERYEADLLLLKLRLESQIVSEWIIVENSYSFQGTHIGLFIRELVDTDQRFDPYRERITVISADRAVKAFPPGDEADSAAFQVERWQRDLAMGHVNALDPDVWIMICDIDEMLDGTSPARMSELGSRLLAQTGVVQVSTQRYWYDFDNQYVPLYGIPLVRSGHLKGSDQTISAVRREFAGSLRTDWDQIVVFEYTSCFGWDEIIRKLNTQAHTGYTVEDLRIALRCNHRVMAGSRGIRVMDSDRDLLARIELTPDNSPEYVRRNLISLRTANIADDYLDQRRKEYPHWERSHRSRLSMWVGRVGGASRRALEWIRRNGIFAIRRLGFRNFGLIPEDSGPSPWLDQPQQ